MIKEDECGERKDLTHIHWGYLNVLQLHDVTGKKIKHPSWQTFWTDLCGSTIRLYKDTSLPEIDNDFPPATMIGPRPESQIKSSFFSLKNGSLKDYDAGESSPKLSRKHKQGRKHVLQIVLANFSVYFLQAPTMSAFYRWRTKIQSAMDNADAPEKLYEKQLRDAKMTMYEQQRCYFKPEPSYPDLSVVDPDTEDEENVSSIPPPCDPRVIALKEKLWRKRRLLNQLEKQERDFLGTQSDNQSGNITRIEFSATAKKNYFLVIGRRDTLISEGRTFTVFGRLPNGRWRCFMDREGSLVSCEDNGHEEDMEWKSYPLIGSVPTSVIVELNQPSRIKDLVDNISLTSSEVSPPGTPADDLSTFNYDVISPPQSSRRSSEPYSNHDPTSVNNLTPTKKPLATSGQSPPPTRPSRITPSGKLDQAFSCRVTRPSESSPTSPHPGTPTQIVSNAMADLNRALESLAALTPRSRLSSGVSTCSRTSTSSQEDDSSDMSRGSRIELVSDDDSGNIPDPDPADVVVRRRKKRDIRITRKLHAKGISIIIGSSSSSEDEDDEKETKKDFQITDKPKIENAEFPSRKIEGLQSSKEKLTEKVAKGVKSSPETMQSKPTNGDSRPSIDKPTATTDLLREFSENGCYGLPIRNSVTQSQFKPLASHEIPPPLHQRRTLQMTRSENEGFGFVLQTNTIIQSGAYSYSMTFVSNVSEDGPAYLAGMRPGDEIIEVENVCVEDDDHQMIVDSLKTAGLTIRLVVIYKDAINRMRLSTKLLALKARLGEAENAYDSLVKKEKMLMDRVQDVDIKVRMEVIYIHILIASTTFARYSPDIKNSVTQTKRTPTELLQPKQSSDVTSYCGESTTGYDLAREFATVFETRDGLEHHQKVTSPKYASDTALNISKKRKVSETKQRTLKQCQDASFVSYVDFGAESRRRVKSDSYDPDDISELLDDFTEEASPKSKTLPVQSRVTRMHSLQVQSRVARPESYMFALGSQNALDTSHFRDLPQARINESSLEDGVV